MPLKVYSQNKMTVVKKMSYDFSHTEKNPTAPDADDASGQRLGEILKVLKAHHIAKGLTPVKLREILEDLGPTYVKLGQIMSMRSDMLPEKYCQELVKLRTDVRPLPFSVIYRIISDELKSPADKIFASIDPSPLGSASIAQVHPAVLNDGRRVVLKVQRPNIHEIMAKDIRLMKKAVGLLKLTMGTGDIIDFNTIIDELWKTSQEEMDFIREAQNCDLFYENQKDIAYVTCPVVIHELTTPRLLVMSYIDGIQIDHREALEKLGYDMNEIGQKTAASYCKQILEDGFFHADPHPGNLRISGGKIAWLDLGMTGRLSPGNKQLIKRAVMALLQNDIYEVKNVLLAMGEVKERINHSRLYTDIDDIVSKYMVMDLGNMHLGILIEKLLDLVKEYHIAITPDITMLGRSMITIEGTLSACAPEVSLLQILSAYMSSMLLEELNLQRELKHKARLIYTSIDKSLSIPALLSDLLNITKNGQTKLNIELSDSNDQLKAFHQTANRLILGILAAALLIGSALFCQVDGLPLILGLPWIGFVGLAAAGLLILWILLSMFFHRKK